MGLWPVVGVTANFDDDVCGIVVSGDVDFVDGEGVGQQFGGGVEVGVDLVFTTCGC